MSYRFVTTFSEKGYEEYGKQFLESYAKHCRIPLYVYYEGQKPPPAGGGIAFFSLNADKNRKAFLKRNEGREVPQTDPGNQYRFQWDRFCHKIFALTNPRNFEGVDWLIWIDADVLFIDDVDKDFLDEVCRGDVSYVGRDEFTHPDCAFVAYCKKRKGEELLSRLGQAYEFDRLFEYDEWHDSYVFNELKDAYDAHNISPGIPGMQVFDDCILGTKMRHLKGPLRKMGAQLPDNPAYQSQQEVSAKGKRPIEIKTKNCVPEVNIQANIHYSLCFIDRWVEQCEFTHESILFCSGGPSLKKYLEEIREQKVNGVRVACVKHAHDDLIEAGIIPDICVLLDPRGHVQDFIENPHPEVLYLVSSMSHPTTIDRLVEKGANFMGYHAHVGAGENDVLKQRNEEAILIGGGCSAAMRGISVLYVLGYTSFVLYGYDLCFDDKPFKGKKPPLKADGTPEYVEVDCLGRRFWTDPEKIAQAQDFEKMIKDPGNRIKIETKGPGMVPHLWAAKYVPLPTFEDLIGGKTGPEGATPGEPESSPQSG